MNTLFFALTLIFLFATGAVMVAGMVSMTKGGEFNKKHGNRLMRARVYLQAATLLFFALTIMTGQSGG